MLSKAKALYQVKLILDYLPEDEYKLIPEETINYIEDNFEYDENFSIDPKIPLEKQKIDEQAYKLLDKIVKSAEKTKKEKKLINNESVDAYIKEIKKSNQNYDMKFENIKLRKSVEKLEKENTKILKARDLLCEYKDALQQKEDEIKKLKKNNQDLYECIEGLPNIVKRMFIKIEI